MNGFDYLYQSAVFYKEHLENRRFKIFIKRKNEVREIELLFLPYHFYHLCGLHKLTDLPYLKRKPKNVYLEILSKKITYSKIAKSVHIDKIRERLIHHAEMLNILKADSLFFKSLHGYFKGINADCVLTKSTLKEELFSFLFIKKSENVYFPCSFFLRNEQKEYTKNGTRWMILSILEITK